MKAIKDNKSYTVNTDEEAKTYVSRGYDIQDDNGKIKEYGSVSYTHLTLPTN